MQHGYFVEDCFLTLNYHDLPILNLELQNRTSFTSQLFFFYENFTGQLLKSCMLSPLIETTWFRSTSPVRGTSSHVSFYPSTSSSLFLS